MDKQEQKRLITEIMNDDAKDGLYKQKTTMKLYTEEQVREAFDNGYKYASTLRPTSIGEHYKYVENSIKSLTPIELPSDEEIEEVSNIRLLYPTDNSANFRLGAKWMKEQIFKNK